MFLPGPRGDHDHRYVPQARVGAHVIEQLVAVHARHLYVQQHQVRNLIMQLFDGVDAVLRREHLERMVLQHPGGDLAHGDRIVDHHDDRRTGVLRCGRDRFGRPFCALEAAPDQRAHVEDDHDLPVGGDRAAEDAWDTADLRPHRFHDDFPVTLQSGHAERGQEFAAPDHQQRHVVAGQRRRLCLQQRLEFEQRKVLARETVRRRVAVEQGRVLAGRHARDPGDTVEGNLEDPIAHVDADRLHHRQAEGDADGEPGALSTLGFDFHRTADLLDLAVDHIHADAAAGQAGDGGGCRKAAFADELQQPLGLPDGVCVDPRAVVLYANHELRGFRFDGDGDLALLGLAELPPPPG